MWPAAVTPLHLKASQESHLQPALKGFLKCFSAPHIAARFILASLIYLPCLDPVWEASCPPPSIFYAQQFSRNASRQERKNKGPSNKTYIAI